MPVLSLQTGYNAETWVFARESFPLHSLLYYTDKSLQQSTFGTSINKTTPLFLLQMNEATWMKT